MRWFLFVAIQIISLAANADWSKVYSDEVSATYIDHTKTTREGGYVTLMTLNNLSAKFISDSSKYGEPFNRSSIAYETYDCGNNLTRQGRYAQYSDFNGKGKIVFSGTMQWGWLQAGSFGVSRQLFKIACGKEPPYAEFQQ